MTGEALLAEAEDTLTRRDLPAALAVFDRAEAAGAEPDRCSAGRWMAHVLLGDYRSAWRESDATRRRGTPDPHRFWDGEEITGKRVIVRSLHGFGDAMQMLRFAPMLASRAQSLMIEVAPRLVELARCIGGVSEVITWGVEAPDTPPAWDVQCEVMELPYLFRIAAADLPVATGYVTVPEPVLEQTRVRMGPRLAGRRRIGIVWAASEWDPERSVPLALLEPLLAREDAEFWNLQHGELGLSMSGVPMRSATEICGDGLLALAATINQLDLVITVDTLAAHLAGALGRPAWLLLQHAADWRWMHGREDSPWYPTLRLFRQPAPGDWPCVIEAVQRALTEPSLSPASEQCLTPR